MFTPTTKRKKIDEATIKLYNNLKDENYNTTITWEQLLQLTETPNLTKPELYYVVLRTNDLLMLNNQKHLKTIQGIGKRIINPNEHTIEARKTAKRSVNVYRKAGKIIASTNLDLLAPEEKSQVIEDAKKWKTLEFFTNEMLKRKAIAKTSNETTDSLSFVVNIVDFFNKSSKKANVEVEEEKK
jgi:hypothetical protein